MLLHYTKNLELADPIGGMFQPPWFELLDIDKTFPLVCDLLNGFITQVFLKGEVPFIKG